MNKVLVLVFVAVVLGTAATTWGATVSKIGSGGGEVITTAGTTDGKLMAVSSYDPVTMKHKVRIYKLEDNGSWVLVREIGPLSKIYFLSFVQCKNAQGEDTLCLVGYEDGGRILMWDAKTGVLIRELPRGSNRFGQNMAVAPGVPMMTVGSSKPVQAVDGPVQGPREPYQATVEIRDGEGKPLGGAVPVPHRGGSNPISGIAMAPGGSYVVTVGGPEGGKYYLCIVTGGYLNGAWKWSCSQKILLPGVGVEPDVSPYGKIVVSISQGNNAYVIDKATGKKVSLPDSQGVVGCRFLADDHTIACGFSDGTVRFYDDKGNKKTDHSQAVCNGAVVSVSKGANNDVYVGCKDGSFHRVQTTSNTSTASPSQTTSPVQSPMSSPSMM